MRIDPSQITHAERWTLRLELSSRHLAAMLHAPEQRGSLQSDVYTLPDDPDGFLHAVETAVYDHPVLLEPYARVEVLLAAPHFILLPTSLTDHAEQLMATAFADDLCDRPDTVVCTLTKSRAAIAMHTEHGLTDFLQRTFATPRVLHSLAPFCEHTANLCAATTVARMAVHIEHRRLQMVAFNGPQLLLANTCEFRHLDDASFMVLHAWHQLGLRHDTDELIIGGEPAKREPVATQLRRYLRYVLPDVTQAEALALDPNAADAPYNLILLALCE